MENGEAMNPESIQSTNFIIKVSHEAKLRELLRNITSVDLQLCSEASKEFMKLLRGDEGGEMLREYVQTSSSCSELLQAWNLRQSKTGLSYIMSLINVILSQKDGLYKPNDVARLSVSRALDKFARLILEEKLGDVYKELNSKEGKGKNAALLLMASVVKRGSGLASDVAKSFNFKLPSFLKLAEYDRRRKNEEKLKRKSSTRRSYVRFAMSFLEIGEPRLLRWVLQQKEMFSGLLRGLGSDEEETVVYVLSTLMDKVLVPESLVPVGLRSVLFGSVTLEQLVNISGRGGGGVATEVATKVLFMVCTDPSNGLMPDTKASPFPLKGNPTRLLGVMKKLKATEIEFHRDLLLGIVRGRPFAAVSLAANLISSVNAGLFFDFLDSQPQEPPSFNSSEVQSIIKCIGPRPFNRIVMNKGLLHSESQIQHGTLRLVLESLKLLDSLFSALSRRSKSSKQIGCKWASLMQDIQNEVQLLLPDLQVLLSLISSLSSRYKSEEQTLKRVAETTVLHEHSSSNKKFKTCTSNEETDIVIGGIGSSLDTATPGDDGRIQEEHNVEESDNLKGDAMLIKELWESHEINDPNIVAEDEESYFYSKLLDALKIYHRTMPSVVEGSFDFFKVLPNNALSLPTVLQQSLLSLLVEHIGGSSKQDIPIRYPPLMYKHLMHFINFVVNSPVKDIKDQAYVLARAAMLSSGAFDNNAREIDGWLIIKIVEKYTKQSFTGQDYAKIGIIVERRLTILEIHDNVYPRFSPLFVCVLEKCLRLLGSKSETFNLPEKSMISMYVSNTLRYLLQTQVEAGLLSSLICHSLSERLEAVDVDFCEWRPLKSLLHFSRSISNQESCMLSSVDGKRGVLDDSFVNLLAEVTSLAESEHNARITTAFSSSMLCAAPGLILQHFPAVISISQNLRGVPFSILLSICFSERGFLNDIFKSWPELSFAGLEKVVTAVLDQKKGDSCSIDSSNSSEAFSYFLKQAPFYVLFPAIIGIECSYLSDSSKFQDMLLAKLSREMSDNFVSSFRLVFFWFHRVQSSYRNGPAKELVQISEICFTLIKRMLLHLSAGNNGSDCSKILSAPGFNHYAQEIAETVFCHPAVIGALESPLSVNKELKGNIVEHLADNFLCLAREGIHRMDHHVLEVLAICCNQMSSFSNDVKFPGDFGYANKQIARVFKCLLQKLVQLLKDRFDQVYFHVVQIASSSELVVADLCLLKAVKIANTCSGPTLLSIRQCMVVSRIVASTPMNLLSKCFQSISMIKAQLLFHLTESSLLHLSFFALPFMEMVNKSLVKKKRKSGVCDEDMVMLLPVALSFLDFISMRYGEKCYKHLTSVHSLYWEILLDGFSNWKTFVSRDLFQVKLNKSVPSTVEELCNLLNNSLLGRAVAVMRHHLVSSGATVKRSKRLKLFDSVLPSGSDKLLDCDAVEIDRYSIDQSLNLILKSVAKVLLCKMVLFPKENIQVLAKGEEADGEIELTSLEAMSSKEYLRSVLFINTLVSTWRLIVKIFPSKSNDRSEVEGTKCALFRLLEVFIFRNFIEVTAEMHKNSDRMSNSLVNLEQIARSCLLHRFEDPATLSMLRVIFTGQADDKSLHIQILQLLLAHSQFAPTIQSATKSSSSLQFGIIFRPMSSILRSLTFNSTDHNVLKVDRSQSSELYMKQLEIVKLLRVLCHIRAQLGTLGFEQDIGINSKELLFLLLSSYGATLSEKDLEIYKLMHELESNDESGSSYIADMDYLWGTAATRVRKVRETEQAFFSDDMDDTEAQQKRRKSQFRENLPIDPRICAATVLHFPYDRKMRPGDLFPNKLPVNNAEPLDEARTANIETIHIYDPVFILRMSLHGLSMDYIEPVEYASLGLLAVAFVSLSSPDDEIRKLGYKVLAVFRNALEISQKRKDVNRLLLLLTYVQNGIGEAWQRIPSIHAVFAAEASVLLLDPSNNHYKIISKLLMHSPMNTKMISFFDEFFWSNSVDFKSGRIWMLRLLYSGQNLDDDAQIYVRSSVLEKLLSFYSSSLSDNESRELILQIVKKVVKFDKTSRYLIEHCGVISWLSSLISNFCGSTYQEKRGGLLAQLAVILEVVNDVVTSRSTIQWLEAHSVEQLTQLSCHLYALFADSFELVKEIHLVDSVLEVLASTLKISQKRDAFQPHLTFSVEGLYQLSQAIDVCCNGEHSPTAELGLEVLLMSTPQAALFSMDLEKLQKFILWAVSIALQANSSTHLPSEGSDYNIQSSLVKEQTNDSLLSKLLRWLTASVILGRLSWQSRDVESKYNLDNSLPETLQSFLEAEWPVHVSSQAGSGSEELLAAIIYYLQQILGRKCEVLPSVVSSLCLLLFPDSSHTGSDALPDGGSTLTSLLSSIPCPAEANPSWRWSFEQPWKNPSTKSSSVDELQACQSILLVVSNVLGKKSSLSHFISILDVENLDVFKWERNLVVETE
ncbi:Nucleolar pre-ribosomal-associated protein 1, N-terminal [Cynara cardunculus var. scolymus]|uniref:Nucleolar pre-ribosomal-associated protein 1, N-terminal n=1 Tax=Cynara cardunculus var. scolymus TaxID=59895 RepID=A0A103YII6_CYNCS|nr:Nucleolar pre-ribosomal-associated protein 1, N-terminal [Cynara cardunculus var. scolymus]